MALDRSQEFEIDVNGKLHGWEAVVLLPFIDEGLLLRAMSDALRGTWSAKAEAGAGAATAGVVADSMAPSINRLVIEAIGEDDGSSAAGGVGGGDGGADGRAEAINLASQSTCVTGFPPGR